MSANFDRAAIRGRDAGRHAPLVIEVRYRGVCPGKWARKFFAPTLSFAFDSSKPFQMIDEVVHLRGGKVVDHRPIGPFALSAETEEREADVLTLTIAA